MEYKDYILPNLIIFLLQLFFIAKGANGRPGKDGKQGPAGEQVIMNFLFSFLLVNNFTFCKD